MEHPLGYDELGGEDDLNRMTRTLRRPRGRPRDSSIVGLFQDALRHKDGSLTVAYQVETPASMFADDGVVEARYDDLARMLAVEKPPGTLIQLRYTTTPDPGQAITRIINSRPREGSHILAGLLQASNLDWHRDTEGSAVPSNSSHDVDSSSIEKTWELNSERF